MCLNIWEKSWNRFNILNQNIDSNGKVILNCKHFINDILWKSVISWAFYQPWLLGIVSTSKTLHIFSILCGCCFVSTAIVISTSIISFSWKGRNQLANRCRFVDINSKTFVQYNIKVLISTVKYSKSVRYFGF